MSREPSALSTKRMLLSSKVEELKNIRPEIASLFAETQPKLFPSATSRQLLAWQELRTRSEARLDEVVALLSEAVRDSSSGSLRNVSTAMRTLVNKIKGEPETWGPTPTFSQQKPSTQEPEKGGAPSPRYLSSLEAGPVQYAFIGSVLLGAVPPTPSDATSCYTDPQEMQADLATSQEVQFTPEIMALAEALNYSPVKIFHYVSNEIKFEPYYGSLKGAVVRFTANPATPQIMRPADHPFEGIEYSCQVR